MFKDVLYVQLSSAHCIHWDHPPLEAVFVGWGRSPKKARRAAVRQMIRIYKWYHLVPLIIHTVVDRDGKIVYQEASDQGVENHWWLDSWQKGELLAVSELIESHI